MTSVEHSIIAKFPEKSAELDVNQESIKTEPMFRRASVDFAMTYGGDIVKEFIRLADSSGIKINDDSRVMCQRNMVKDGFYPSPPNWHIDVMPGEKVDIEQSFLKRTVGAIGCFADDPSSTTEFLSSGKVSLTKPTVVRNEYTPGEYLGVSEGHFEWISNQINLCLNSGDAKSAHIDPGVIYSYDSSQFHKAPRFVTNLGYRLLVRINTPAEGQEYKIAAQDRFITEDSILFAINEICSRWKRIDLST